MAVTSVIDDTFGRFSKHFMKSAHYCKATLQLVRGIEQDNSVKHKHVCAKVMQAYLESRVQLHLIVLEDVEWEQNFISNSSAHYVTD